MAVGMCLILMLAMLVSVPAFAQEKVIQLTINDHNPPMSPPGQAMDHWAKEVEKLCKGRVKLNVHHGGALLKGDEVYRGVQTGVADAGHYVVDRQQGFILNTVIALPFMDWPGQVETGQIYMDLQDIPEVAGEWKDVTLIGVMMMPPTHIHNNKKVVKTPADLKGLKLHGAEVAHVRAMAAAGATPIELDIADMFMGLDRGLIDGVMNHFPVLKVFGVLELMQYHTIFGDGGMNMNPMMVIMNNKKLKSLPPDIQKIIVDSGHIWSDKFYEGDFAFQKISVDECKNWNHTFTYLTPKEIKAWYKLVKGPVHDKWIEETEAKGLPGKAVYKKTLKLIKKYKKK